jgi:DNA ligase (NAD+)
MNPDNPFIGKSVAVTGKLENYTRDGIKARLLALGARPVSKVSNRTDYLILGVRPGNKLVKALALGITVLSEQEFETINN